jgi:hypothetical protein
MRRRHDSGAAVWFNGSMTARQPIGGPAAWHGRTLAPEAWTRPLDGTQIAALDGALRQVNQRGLPMLAIAREDFPLPGLEPLVADILAALEDGTGMVRLTGFPAERYSLDDLRRLFWGLGTHLGTAVNQSARGEWIGEVRDESGDRAPSYVEQGPGKVKSSRARARSNGPLRFHTDRCDVIGLLCARNSMTGGVSKLASAVTIHDEMLKRRPDLLDVLFEDFWRSRPEDEDGMYERPYFALPVFGMERDRLTTQYSRTYVEQAQEYPEVPRLTPAQLAAMDLLAELAEEVCHHAPFAVGDMQFVNNHVVFHGRTAYEDDRASGRSRLLLRLWLSPPNSRPLPAHFAHAWHATAPGAVRGGIPAPQKPAEPALG